MLRRPARSLSALGAITALLAVGMPHAASAAPSPAPADTLTWKGCGSGFQCATLSVPVDWSQPSGPQVPLAVSRHRASQPSERIGSLVVNFGGPGDPGAESLRQGGEASLPAAVRDRFDIVSFDPRGTGMSRPIACVSDPTYDDVLAQSPTPKNLSQLQSFYAGTNGPVDLVQACISAQGAWLADVGTRNTARDLDALRAALGEPKLTYLGYSYGTVLGAVYAQMYPTRVRAMVLDGAVDLSSTPAAELHDNAVGFEQALDAFLANCAANAKCPYHHGGDPQAALAALQQQFENGLTLSVADGRRAGATLFYLALAGGLYDRKVGWPFLASALAAVDRGIGDGIAELADTLTGRDPNGHYDDLQEALAAIRCDDRFDPLQPFNDYVATYEAYSQEFPIFGAFLAASPLGCDPRLPQPPASAQVGDVHVTGTPPILIVGTTNDPATPYNGAIDLQQRITGSRLLTLVSTEHAGYGKGIPCIDNAVDTYFIDRVLPHVGLRCRP
ncbi:MAG TPA: alpha/beta hydrolase [Acidimicrobiia bacterium]|nr:alpha/beta hydrolase [Acidimicrobiia bacterium]